MFCYLFSYPGTLISRTKDNPKSVPEGIILADQLYLFDIYELFVNRDFFLKKLMGKNSQYITDLQYIENFPIVKVEFSGTRNIQFLDPEP